MEDFLNQYFEEFYRFLVRLFALLLRYLGLFIRLVLSHVGDESFHWLTDLIIARLTISLMPLVSIFVSLLLWLSKRDGPILVVNLNVNTDYIQDLSELGLVRREKDMDGDFYRKQVIAPDENREAIRVLSRQVIEGLVPGEIPATMMVMEPLIDKAGQDEVVPVGKGKAFGFGDMDLLAQVVIPVVVGILSNMLYSASVQRIKDLRQHWKARSDDIAALAKAEVADKVKRTGKRLNKKQAEELIAAIIRVITLYVSDVDQGEDETPSGSLEPLPQSELGQLRDKIAEAFNDGELQNLCQDLDIAYDDLPGADRRSKARELVSYCQRRGKLAELKQICRHQRPYIFTE